MKNPMCSFHYEELKVTTELLPNIGKQIDIDTKVKNISSYTYQRYSADGIQDEVQLNLHDEIIDKQGCIKAISSKNSKIMNVLTATYQLKRLIAFMDDTNYHSVITEELSVNNIDSDSDKSTQL